MILINQRFLNNISSLNGQNKLGINNISLYRALARLASGKRINSGADDAAGLQIADSLRGNVYALNQAMRNASDGLGFCQIADGALSVITDMLHRMVTLAEEAVSEIIGVNGNKALDAEFQQLQAEMARIVRSTNYNGMNILDCDLREYGETLDVFVGDLSAVSYIPIKIGCITIGEVVSVSPDPSTIVPDYTIDISTGVDSLGATSGDGWSFSGNTLTINDTTGKTYQITGTTTTNSIVVASGSNTNVILSDANINVSGTGGCAFEMTGATVNLYLDGDNSLSSGGGHAGIEVPWGTGSEPESKIVITSLNGDSLVDGVLFVSGGGAGIGGGEGLDGLTIGRAGSITINGGTINASGLRGAGIGGSATFDLSGLVTVGNAGGGIITINGGNITALGGTADIWGAAGIGSTQNGDGLTGIPNVEDDTIIIITGGTIYAEGCSFYGGAGIGGAGSTGSFGTIEISGGDITAVGGTAAAGIGQGHGSNHPDSDATIGGDIIIRGGKGNVIGGLYGAAGIGQGIYGTAVNINIYGECTSNTITTIDGVFNVTGGIAGIVNLYGFYNPSESPASTKVGMFNMNPDSGLIDVNLLTPKNALLALNHVSTALNEVSIMRGAIGAGMNRLQSAINVLAATSMNTLAAESNIRDANIAEEITNMAKFQILAQTGMAALLHSNANAQNVLSLLR